MRIRKTPAEQLAMIEAAGFNYPEYCVLAAAHLGVPLRDLARQAVGLNRGDPRGEVTEEECQWSVDRLVRDRLVSDQGRLTDGGESRFRALVESLGYHWAMPFEFPEDDLPDED